LALAGLPIIGHFRSWCSGHRMNVAVLEALFADRTAYEIVEDRRSETVLGQVRTRVAAVACAPSVD
jgi:UDP-3-O-[3-hydroxymyristoyl] N-acetylglucosamine deacetylase